MQTIRARSSQAAGAARRGHHPALALAVIAASQLMIVLDISIVNIALPHVQQALGFSTTSLSWVVNAYTLAFGGLLLLGGRAGDILGRRRVFMTGILVFTLASLLGGLAQEPWQLLAARALQGVGGAIASLASLAYGFIRAAEEGWRDSLTIGSFTAAAVLLLAFGLIERRAKEPITPLR